MNKVHGEIIFHVKGDTATIINFKNIPMPGKIVETYGSQLYTEYVTSGASCILEQRLVPSSRFPVNTLNVDVELKEKSDKKSSVFDAYGQPVAQEERFFYLEIWEKVSLQKMKDIQEVMEKANDHLNELIEKYQKKEKER
jgi:hypothetical protein